MIARTLDEIERHAHANGDAAIVALIHQTEEEFDGFVSPEHEAVIDDRNRLRDALTECLDRMDDAVDQLDEFNTTEATPDLVTGELPVLNFAPAFGDAIFCGREALKECEPQVDDTVRQKYAKSEQTIVALRHQLAAQEDKLRAADSLVRAVRHVLTPYRTRSLGVPLKTPPKWAQFLVERLPHA